ncbi:MAG: VIT1/CCC1 transporter family protein [Acidimicrobiaceae bacterium]
MAKKTLEHEGHPDHRALAGGSARAGVFGFSDGLVSNVSLIIGFAAGGVDSSVVRLAGIAAAVAGAASMAAGEWVSISAQNDLVEREMALELRE